ncbi:MAG: hypothetical protein RIE06_28570 [Roseibium album]|uniref:hypothetical protein n=1 Tax=Roseibium album TaxID=311410 RepID=UPI0032EE1937
MFTPLKYKIHEIAPDLQFWGYEGGNVLAAIAGAGGFFAFYEGLRSVSEIPADNLWSTVATAFSTYPDIIVTAGLAVIVLLTIFLGRFLGAPDRGQAKTWIDRTSSLAGIGLVLGALYFGASWITFTAVSFVSASALLRLCRTSPVFLKLGGLMLAAGGFGLAGYGLSTVQDTQSALLPGLTVLTGIYVFFASLMTYQGGIYECNAIQEELGGAPSSNDPFRTDGLLARLLVSGLDRPIGVFGKAHRPAIRILGVEKYQVDGAIFDIHVDTVAVEGVDRHCRSCDWYDGRRPIRGRKHALGGWRCRNRLSGLEASRDLIHLTG